MIRYTPEKIKKLLDLPNNLTKQQIQIVTERFGLNDGIKKTLDYLSNILGIPREEIRQEETRALRLLFKNEKEEEEYGLGNSQNIITNPLKFKKLPWSKSNKYINLFDLSESEKLDLLKLISR